MSLRSTALAAAVILSAALPLATPLEAVAAPARTSLTSVENDLMCVVCHESLAVARAPEADSERSYISGLVAAGDTKAQIERAMVAQYGSSVLALPPAHGFNLTVYLLPPAILVAGIVMLMITLPRWRRQARAAARASLPAGPPLDPSDARRLDEDLARYQ